MEAIVYKNSIKLLICYNQNYKVGNQWIDGLMDGWIDGSINALMDEWIDKCIDRWMDRSKDISING